MKYYSLITNKNCVQNNSKEFDMHPNIFMHHVNFDGYFLTVEIEKHALCPIQMYPYQKKHHSMNDVSWQHIVYSSIPKSYFSEAVVLIPTVTFHQPLFLFSIAFRSSPSAYEFPFYFLRSHESMIWKSICAYVRLLNFSLHTWQKYPFDILTTHLRFGSEYVLYHIQRTHVVWKSQLTKTFFLHV